MVNFNVKECIFPWTELQINYNGTYGICCYQDPFTRETEDFYKLWNSADVQSYRNFISKYDAFPNSRCHRCSLHKMKMHINTLPMNACITSMSYDNTLSEQKQNVHLMQREFEEKNLVVKHFPARIYLNFGLQCNLSCKMCSQMGIRKEHKETLDPALVIKNMDFLSHASEIFIIGGEPFLLKPALDFLEFASMHETIKNIRFAITTNATLLDKHIELLSRFKHLNIFCSIDSSGEYYEKIRIGAKWEKVKTNIEILNELGKNRPGWLTITISCLLMKSGIPGLLGLCEWCIHSGLPLNFGRVFDDADPSIRLENMFEYPEVLDDMPEWENIFFDCIALLNKHDYKLAAKQLIMYYQEIRSSLNYLQIKSENAAPLQKAVLYKKGANDLQYNRGDKPHIATPFFATPLAEDGQELFITMQFTKPQNSFTVVVQNRLYDQLAAKMVNNTDTTTAVQLTFNIHVCYEELRLVFYPASGIIDDFVPASLEVATNGASREFMRYSKLKAELEGLERLKTNAVQKDNTIFRKCKRFFKERVLT